MKITLRSVTGLLVALLGIGFLVLGGWLIGLGGSWYYALAGIGLIACGVQLLRERASGAAIYAAVFVFTLVWALWEVGTDGWQLMPRLFAPAILGIWISLATDTRRLWPAAVVYGLCAVAVIGLGYRTSSSAYQHFAAVPPAPATSASADWNREWRYYGGTEAGDRFASAAQITPQNVAQLQPAWTFHTGDLPRDFETKKGREFNFEATPIKVGDDLYFCTPHRWIIALDATSGKLLWKYDPKSDTSANEYLACRGVAYDEAPTDADCPTRIITTTAAAEMIALDARTGRLCAHFGQGGRVSLSDHMGPVPPGFHFITSQPLIERDRIILGGWIYDNQAEGEPSGVVRAYDATTGALAWAWDMGRNPPNAPLGPNDTYTRGTPNGWGTYTADPALGLVYIPLGNATPDYFGAHRRPFDETYSSAVVALDIETGQERWHFQTVHHDVWDFDLPIGPSLVDLDGPSGKVPALVQTTKTGELYLLDRRSGQPLAEVAEKAVPQGPLPGDHLSATQPYSVGMPSLAPEDLRETDMWGATPIDQLWCRIQYRRLRYDGQYTPPTLGGDIAYPAFDGVVDWYGATIDQARHLLIANASYIPFTVDVMPAEQAIAKGLMKPWPGWESGQTPPKPKEFAVGPQYGTPFAAVVQPWLGLFDAPCNRPIWGKLVAIDLGTRKIAWTRPLGTARDTGLFNTHVGLPLPTGAFNIGGNIVTAGGLIFVGATTDQYLRAFDETSGAELWRARLPAGGQATPMTYIGADGRQYVVISAGGHGGLRTRNGDAVMAFALPKGGG